MLSALRSVFGRTSSIAGQLPAMSVRKIQAAGKSSSRLDGRVAIVTASTEGIGFAIARKLGLDGATVMVSSRKQQNVDKAVEKLKEDNINVAGMVCHVGKEEDRKQLIQETVDKFGKLDILVSNAAVNPIFGPIMEATEKAWDKIFDVNVKASFLLAKEAYPHLKNSHNGSIVFVSSVGGFVPLSGLGAYSVSKTALFGLTRALSVELGVENIRVNCLAPGIIKTHFSSAIWTSEAATERIVDTLSIKRLGQPEDCGGTVSFLCSDDASYITGEIILVTGGMQARL
ncbi:dehydrogenase/reductase SDR family member 4-like [Dysidea avara]|uniref:dehydrogenase/reductase SDR family member 4-like n=1 Tax=Dysidea avara TaxID=196820 RepID=UPI00332651DD